MMTMMMPGHSHYDVSAVLAAIRSLYASLPELKSHLLDALAGSPEACAKSARSDVHDRGLPVTLLKLVILDEPGLCARLYDSYDATTTTTTTGTGTGTTARRCSLLDRAIPIWPVVCDLYEQLATASACSGKDSCDVDYTFPLDPDFLPTRLTTNNANALTMRLADVLLLQYHRDRTMGGQRESAPSSRRLLEQYMQRMPIPPGDAPYTPTSYVFAAVRACGQLLQDNHDLGDLNRAKYDLLQSARRNIGKIKKKPQLAPLIENAVLRRLLLLKLDAVVVGGNNDNGSDNLVNMNHNTSGSYQEPQQHQQHQQQQGSTTTNLDTREVLHTAWNMALADMRALRDKAERVEKDVQAKGLGASSSEEVLQMWTKIWSTWGLGACVCVEEPSFPSSSGPAPVSVSLALPSSSSAASSASCCPGPDCSRECIKCLARLQEAGEEGDISPGAPGPSPAGGGSSFVSDLLAVKPAHGQHKKASSVRSRSSLNLVSTNNSESDGDMTDSSNHN